MWGVLCQKLPSKFGLGVGVVTKGDHVKWEIRQSVRDIRWCVWTVKEKGKLTPTPPKQRGTDIAHRLYGKL